MNQTDAVPQINRIQQIAIGVAVVGIVLAAIFTFLLGTKAFFQSYLMAFVFWFGLSLGSLALLMIHHVAGYFWSFSIRRLLEAGAIQIVLVAIFFLPIMLPPAMDAIYYRWYDLSYEGRDAIIEFKEPYLNYTSWAIRSVLYFVIWFVLAGMLYKWSRDQDNAPDGDFSHAGRMRKLSAIGLVLYVITMTTSSVDWFMSIEPHFFSTIYGVLFMVGQGLSTLAFILLLLSVLGKYRPLSEVLTSTRIHSIGKMMLGFVILWAYVSFAQYVIIWSGNLPEFTPWYINRTESGWNLIALMLIIFHFAVPFFLLLSRRYKRSLNPLWLIAALILLMRLFDIFWLIAPDFSEEGLRFDPLYLSLLLALGGIWIASFSAALKRRPLLPTNELRKDPRVQEGATAHA